ncbi:Acyl-ACP thioesterase [Fodinibius salinus]|uniref:Acyl-ACP thioesterase n=1 Tax=Fodinibius salinus TaxID=860790 RepID=A0A5D3YM66_9BACT|nr:acyl-ACP thioesterase domain-containing protein [Fodinibius salinus]TYP94990.1 Acyl-ACP thioesterase [Fodinibius salinus]
MPQQFIYEEEFKIRASEIGADKKATLAAICSLLQEVAGNHALQLEFDITDLQQQKMTWVLHRLNIQIHRFPDWRETITIKTWPSGGDGLRAHRDFLLLDESGHTVGKSLSYWLILDMDKRRPIRIPKDILQNVPRDTEHVLPVTDPAFEEIGNSEHSNSFEVRKTDLDLNEHVNNVRYIEWALSSMPEDKKLSKIDIKFIAEAVLGDNIIAEYTSTPKERFQIKRRSDEAVLALAHAT